MQQYFIEINVSNHLLLFQPDETKVVGGLSARMADNYILTCALSLKKQCKYSETPVSDHLSLAVNSLIRPVLFSPN